MPIALSTRLCASPKIAQHENHHREEGMDSMPLLLGRVTVSGLAIINFLILWLFVRQASHGDQRRRTTRHSIFLLVDIHGKKGVKALINDLSLGGCRISGNLAVRHGEHLPLRLHPPGQASPILIERAAVRWIGEKDFGLQFMSVPSGERARLGQLLQWVA
jgi:c-di-GMP-binding flagellar brake protein YcgR